MANVFLHVTATPECPRWKNSPQEFLRLPVVGEYIALSSTDNKLYKVVFVVHNAFECEYVAEVYAVRVDQQEEEKLALRSESE